MKFWTVMLMFLALSFAWACDSGETVTDEGNAQDVVDQDTATEDTTVPDTAVPDVAPDTNVPVDTAIPDDEGTGQDTNVPVDLGQPEDVAPTCPTGVSTGAACQAAGSCATQCDDEAFVTDCLVQADQAAKDAFAAFQACAATSECGVVYENEQLTECITTTCKDVTEACFVGTLTCQDIWTCRKDCPADDPACSMACVTSGTLEAQTQWIAYKNCILDIECAREDVQDNGWPLFTCEQYARGFCSLPYQGCFPPI